MVIVFQSMFMFHICYISANKISSNIVEGLSASN